MWPNLTGGEVIDLFMKMRGGGNKKRKQELIIGLAILLIGLFPKITSILWLYLGYSFFVVYLGKLLQAPDWMGKLSPFGNIPQYPVDEINYLTISLLIALAAIVTLIGFIGYRKRDIAG